MNVPHPPWRELWLPSLSLLLLVLEIIIDRPHIELLHQCECMVYLATALYFSIEQAARVEMEGQCGKKMYTHREPVTSPYHSLQQWNLN